MLSNSWHKKEKPIITMIGMSGGSTSLGVKSAGDSSASEAGKSGATHYWDLGYTGGTDQNGNYDMTSYGTVTLEQTIGDMPPGVNLARQQTTDFNSGIKNDTAGFDLSGAWTVEIYVYPTSRPSSGWDGAIMQWKSGQTYNVAVWPFYASDNQTRYDYANAGYGSRLDEDTAWGTGASPVFDTWNHIRIGRNSSNILKMERRTWDGSSWSPGTPSLGDGLAEANTGGGGPTGSGAAVTMLNSEGNSNDDYTGRGIKGYIGPCLFVAGSLRTGAPSAT